MQDCIDLGGAPSHEDCAQVGSRDYDYADRAKRECRAYFHQLRRMFGEEPEGARLSIKSNPHDFGTYYSVVCYFESDSKPAIDYAYRCEAGPESWDAEARRELEQQTQPPKETEP
jgi:hypothetical protein